MSKVFNFNKKSAFSLAEVLVTLGLIGAVSALTIPTLAYNYRAKVLEEQFRSTYSDIRQIGTMINYDKGDVGVFANKASFSDWEKEFVNRLNGGNKLLATPSPSKIKQSLKDFYRSGGGSPGPYYFSLNNSGQREEVGGSGGTAYLCDNGNIWLDSKGRIWTFNTENRIICVDINGTANPNRYNIDIFSFTPMSSEMVATWVYDDRDHPTDYTGAIVPCDIEQQHRNNLGNTIPVKQADGKYKKGTGSALDYCPFNEPIENIAAVNSYKKGKSAKGKPVTTSNNYWKDYINYK
jgi:type II secretory pathway pseudopilin PulG